MAIHPVVARNRNLKCLANLKSCKDNFVSMLLSSALPTTATKASVQGKITSGPVNIP